MDSNFLIAEAEDDRTGKEGGKFLARFQRLADCCGKTKRNRDGRASGDDDDVREPPEGAMESSDEEKEVKQTNKSMLSALDSILSSVMI